MGISLIKNQNYPGKPHKESLEHNWKPAWGISAPSTYQEIDKYIWYQMMPITGDVKQWEYRYNGSWSVLESIIFE